MESVDDELDDDLARALTHLPLDCFVVLRVEMTEDGEQQRKVLSAAIVQTPDGGDAVVQVGVSVAVADYGAFESLVIEMVERYCLVIESEEER